MTYKTPCMASLSLPLRAASLVRQVARARQQCRLFSNKKTSSSGEFVDTAQLLKRPTWSVRSLLPEKTMGNGDISAAGDDTAITPALLRHLLRLSALPYPSSPEEQAAKIDTLRSQLHFVRDVQSVNTLGLQPLQAIRDETREALQEQTIGIKDIEQTLLQEESFGHNKRPRRRKTQKGKTDMSETESWDLLGMATQTAGRYVVVAGIEQGVSKQVTGTDTI